jgi:hypothetical protein
VNELNFIETKSSSPRPTKQNVIDTTLQYAMVSQNNVEI